MTTVPPPPLPQKELHASGGLPVAATKTTIDVNDSDEKD